MKERHHNWWAVIVIIYHKQGLGSFLISFGEWVFGVWTAVAIWRHLRHHFSLLMVTKSPGGGAALEEVDSC